MCWEGEDIANVNHNRYLTVQSLTKTGIISTGNGGNTVNTGTTNMPLLYDTSCYANVATSYSLFTPLYIRMHHKNVVTSITYKLVNFETVTSNVTFQLEAFYTTGAVITENPTLADRVNLGTGAIVITPLSVKDVTFKMQVIYYSVTSTDWKLRYSWSVCYLY